MKKKKKRMSLLCLRTPRNTASGTLKLQDSGIVADRNLDCFLYGLYQDRAEQTNHFDAVSFAGEMGFKIPRLERKNDIQGF